MATTVFILKLLLNVIKIAAKFAINWLWTTINRLNLIQKISDKWKMPQTVLTLKPQPDTIKIATKCALN